MRATNLDPDVTLEEKRRVLKKALIRVVDKLELTRQELSAIIGPSESSLSRLYTRADYYLDPFSKEGQLAVLLIRLYRSLDILFGGNLKQCQQWLRSDNRHLKKVPIALIQSIQGLIFTIEYLDAMRGKN